MTAARFWAATVAASTAAATAAALVAPAGPLRAILVFWFLLAVPGMAVIPLLGVQHRLSELTLVVAASLALDTLVAETMLLAKAWSPEVGLVILGGLSLLGAAAQLGREARRRALAPGWASVEVLDREAATRDPEDEARHRDYMAALSRFMSPSG